MAETPAIELALYFHCQQKLTVTQLVLGLISKPELSRQAATVDLISHAQSICSALLKSSLLEGNGAQDLAFATAQERLQEEVRQLARPEHGFHFNALTAQQIEGLLQRVKARSASLRDLESDRRRRRFCRGGSVVYKCFMPVP
jgi:hypothetical protein